MSLQTSVQTGKEEWTGVAAFIVSTLSWSPDGHLLAAGLETLPPGGFIQIIDVDTGQILDSFYAGTACRLSLESRWQHAGSRPGEI